MSLFPQRYILQCCSDLKKTKNSVQHYTACKWELLDPDKKDSKKLIEHLEIDVTMSQGVLSDDKKYVVFWSLTYLEEMLIIKYFFLPDGGDDWDYFIESVESFECIDPESNSFHFKTKGKLLIHYPLDKIDRVNYNYVDIGNGLKLRKDLTTLINSSNEKMLLKGDVPIFDTMAN